ncbi:MAG: hypothetical protein GYA41_05590 [Bacteroidales bacterium]|nr:hypothetical protein [Bacteroidales bacterium]
MDPIIVKEVISRKEFNQFISLPHEIHRYDVNWLPTLFFDDRKLFSRERNIFLRNFDSVFLLAYRNLKPAGRIIAHVRKNDPEENRMVCRFCYMDSYNDPPVVHALFEKVEQWAKKKGAKRIIGPMGFSIKDPQGFQVEGFNYPPVFATSNNSAFLPCLMENEGYEKDIDLVNYVIDIPSEYPPFYRKAYERAMSNSKIKIIEFRTKKEIRPYIIPGLELMNETYTEQYGYVNMTEEEKQDLAREFYPVLDPDFVKGIEFDGKLVGFIIGIADFSKGIMASRGRLFPFGLFRILASVRKSEKLIFVLGGINKSFRGQGIDILMAVRMFEAGLKHGMKLIDSHLILESNRRMRAEYEIFSGRQIKRFRIYRKTIKT